MSIRLVVIINCTGKRRTQNYENTFLVFKTKMAHCSSKRSITDEIHVFPSIPLTTTQTLFSCKNCFCLGVILENFRKKQTERTILCRISTQETCIIKISFLSTIEANIVRKQQNYFR